MNAPKATEPIHYSEPEWDGVACRFLLQAMALNATNYAPWVTCGECKTWLVTMAVYSLLSPR